MTARARETLVSRRSWLLAGLTASLSHAFEDQPLQVRYDSDNLRVAAPSVHFLSGKALERLHDGDAVAYLASLELINDARTLSVRQQKGRFVVSYALWEEKFSVTQLGGNPVTVEDLSISAAEAWCLDRLALSTLGLAADRYYWLRFGIRTANARDIAASGLPGFSIRDWIERLGKRNTVQNEWGPLERRVRLVDLPRLAGRGSRG